MSRFWLTMAIGVACMHVSIANAALNEEVSARCNKLQQCASQVPNELSEGINAGIEECQDISGLTNRFHSEWDSHYEPDAIPGIINLYESCLRSANELDCPEFFMAMESTPQCQKFDQAMRSERKPAS